MISKRVLIWQPTVLCFLSQCFLLFLIIRQLGGQWLVTIVKYQADATLIIARFVCAAILHWSLIDNFTAGLDKMKYACNHKRDFSDWKGAYIAGQMQANIVLVVELVCLGIIMISETPMDIAGSFASLVIIAEFDVYIYKSQKNEVLKRLLKKELRN
jgi:hypothetical protein